MLTLDKAKVLQFDAQADSRVLLEKTLIQMGFQSIGSSENEVQFSEKLEQDKPDLVFVDIDADRAGAFKTIRAIRNGGMGGNPFVVIVALTGKPALETVEAALQAGSDDMVVKPVTVEALRQRITNQIEDRKDFIATDDYVGPDRRPEDREPSDDELAAIEAPNSLRHRATGDESVALSEERVKETLRALSVQKFFHLSAKIGRAAAGQRDLLAGNAPNADHAQATLEITAALAEIDEIIGEQSFKSVQDVVASTRKALEDITARGDGVEPHHFDLLQVHGGSIGVVLKESDESAGALVSELEKAVKSVKKLKKKPRKKAAAPANAAAEPEPQPEPAPASPPDPAPCAPEPAAASQSAEPPAAEPPAANGKHPFKVRFKAWWDGVDPQDIAAGGQK